MRAEPLDSCLLAAPGEHVEDGPGCETAVFNVATAADRLEPRAGCVTPSIEPGVESASCASVHVHGALLAALPDEHAESVGVGVPVC